MNMITWVLAGAFIGWFTHSVMHINAERRGFIAIVIGMAGAYFGGNTLSPMLGSAEAGPSDFSLFALVLAAASAAACLKISDIIYERYGV